MKNLTVISILLLAACAYEDETPRGFVGEQPVILPAECIDGQMVNIVDGVAESINDSAMAGPQAYVCVEGGWIDLEQETNQ